MSRFPFRAYPSRLRCTFVPYECSANEMLISIGARSASADFEYSIRRRHGVAVETRQEVDGSSPFSSTKVNDFGTTTLAMNTSSCGKLA